MQLLSALVLCARPVRFGYSSARSKFLKILFILTLFACSLYTTAQIPNFREALRQADPLPQDTSLTFVEKAQAHQHFLEQAHAPQERLYGFLLLFKDYIQDEKYAEATRCLLEAEAVAKAADQPGWLGAVRHRQGILSVYLKQYAAAIPYYADAVALCGQAHDSLCIAESLEQLSSMYGRVEDYPKAHQYFEQAMPLLERYGGDVQQCVALNNFANLLALQERPAEAISYFKQALAISERIGDQRREAQFLSNLADSYCQLQRFDQAFAAYRRCIAINRAQHWAENLVFNYQGISVVYEQTGDFRPALDFYKQFRSLRDSLLGAETQEQIADLQVKYDSQAKELALQKSQAELDTAQRSLQVGTLLFASVLVLAIFGLLRRRSQIRQARQKLLQNQAMLQDLTRVLVDKNAQLTLYQEEKTHAVGSDTPAPDPVDPEKTFYNQRILTDADWAAFKTYFEKAYPGYLLRLRTANPQLSDAEERLFLLIKLNLTRKEVAAMLGISADSVKKTRYRLRKRLELEDEADLDGYVRAF